MIPPSQIQPGMRVQSVHKIRTPRGFPKTVTSHGVVVAIDPEDAERALVRFDGFGDHVSHPLLAILHSDQDESYVW